MRRYNRLLTEQHPFAGRPGSRKRNALVEEVGERDGYTCWFCGCVLYRGRRRSDSLVLEHLEPHRLSPERAFDAGNLVLSCKGCHDTTSQAIEAQFPGDAGMIREAKLRHTEQW